jgi:hypothetical protein
MKEMHLLEKIQIIQSPLINNTFCLEGTNQIQSFTEFRAKIYF